MSALRQAVIRRTVVFGLSLLSTAFAGLQMHTVLAGDRFELLDGAMLAFFVVCFAWVTLSFWTAVAGFLALVLGRRPVGLVRPDRGVALPITRTAILMPIYNEDAGGVFARIEAMMEAIDAIGARDVFDVFVLSDSTDPDAWIAEEEAWAKACRRLDAAGRLFYRKRRRNIARKSGNIADFCTRWGAGYPYMVVLDADSLMTAEALVEMVRIMDANPDVGLVQVPPTIVNRTSLFARMQQFAGRVYGPIFAVGQAFWQLGEGNYWGHNAIIRTRAFAACCGLPILPGAEPFGGHILSHDFVEAALLRRAGWQVWMAPDLGGSYEESPPTLVDFAKRDRRWCQGNLQHMMVLPAAGLHPVSRLHLVIGIMSYVSSPLWLGFLMAGLAVAVRDVLIPPQYFPPEGTLFPDWPIIHTALAEGLFAWAFAMLIVPRLLGVAVLLADAPARRASGGGAAVVSSALLEILFSTILAPVMMVFQSTFVLDVLRGRDSGWTRQRREDGSLGWREALAVHRVHLLAGLAIAAVVWTFTPGLLFWLSPVIAGLVLSPALSVATASRGLGLAFRRLGLFVTPEEAHPPWELSRTNALAAARPAAAAAPALARLLADPAALAVHLATLPVHQEGSPGDDEALASALKRIAQVGGRLDRAGLSPRETMALLFDAPSLVRLAGLEDARRAAA